MKRLCWLALLSLTLLATHEMQAEESPREILLDALNKLYNTTVSYDAVIERSDSEPSHYVYIKKDDGTSEGIFFFWGNADKFRNIDELESNKYLLCRKFNEEKELFLFITKSGTCGFSAKRYLGESPFEELDESSKLELESIEWRGKDCWRIIQITSKNLKNEYIIGKSDHCCYNVKNYRPDGRLIGDESFINYNFEPDVSEVSVALPEAIEIEYAEENPRRQYAKWLGKAMVSYLVSGHGEEASDYDMSEMDDEGKSEDDITTDKSTGFGYALLFAVAIVAIVAMVALKIKAWRK